MARSRQTALHDTTPTRRTRFIGHILRLLSTRVAGLTLEWILEDGSLIVSRQVFFLKNVRCEHAFSLSR